MSRIGKILVMIILLALTTPTILATRVKAAPAPVRLIKMGWCTDFTGPSSASVGPQFWGAQDYFKYLNTQGGIKAKGGVVKVETLWIDAACKLDRCLEAYERWKADPDFLVTFNTWTSFGLALKDKCEADQIIHNYCGMTADVDWPVSEWTYGTNPTHSDSCGQFVDWVMENWREKRPPRMAFLKVEFAYGKETADVGGGYARARGMEITGVETVPGLPTDTTIQLKKLAAGNPDYIYLIMTSDQSAVVVKDAYRLNLGIKLVHCSTSPPSELVHFCGKEASNGVMAMIVTLHPVFLDKKFITPEIQKAIDLFNKYRPGEKMEAKGDYFKGVAAALVAGEAVRLALEHVSAQELNAKSLNKYGYQRVRNFNPWGLQGLYNYPPDDHRGCDSGALTIIEDGVIKLLTKWDKTPIMTTERLIWSKYVKAGTWEEIAKRKPSR